MEWNAGASRLKASHGSDGIQRGGGKRGDITGFSFESRRRLLQLIGSIKRDCILPVFVTLTYPKSFPNPNEAKRHLKIFFQAIKRKFPDVGIIWKLEPQERGAPHFHMLVWGATLIQLRAFVPGCWYSIAGQRDRHHLLFHQGKLGNEHCCGQVKSFRGVWFYAAKYIGKTFEIAGWKWSGRFWGVWWREQIPFGEVLKADVQAAELVQLLRYQRRFSGIKSRPRGLTIFCDADQWVERLKITPKKQMAMRD